MDHDGVVANPVVRELEGLMVKISTPYSPADIKNLPACLSRLMPWRCRRAGA